jgi:hypothetical protein
MMKSSLDQLHPHEFEALLEALRRDMRAESNLSRRDQKWADWHKMNAWLDQKLLEALNPKRSLANQAHQDESQFFLGTDRCAALSS